METILIRQHVHQYIDKAPDAQVEAIYTLLESKVEAVQNRISLEQYNIEIEASDKEYETGNYITQEQLKKEVKKW